MRISSNDKLIRRRSKIGLYSSLAGMGVLVLGLIFSFQPNYLWVSLLAVIVGFFLAQYGNYHLRRWGRSPRPDQVIALSLKGFDDRYHYYAWSLPAPYVLLTPHGVYSFVTRDQPGVISVHGSRWQSKFNVWRLLTFFGQEGLGNPTEEALAVAGHLSSWIRKNLPDITVDVQPVVLFIDERVQLSVTEPTVPVMEARNLKKWLRGSGKGEGLKSSEYKAIEELFDANVAALTKR